MPLTTVTRRSIIDVAGVLETPLKLVTIKRFKINNRKIMLKATKIWKNNFSGGNCPGGNFPGGHFSRGQFSRGGIFLGAIFQGDFFPDTTLYISICLMLEKTSL